MHQQAAARRVTAQPMFYVWTFSMLGQIGGGFLYVEHRHQPAVLVILLAALLLDIWIGLLLSRMPLSGYFIRQLPTVAQDAAQPDSVLASGDPSARPSGRRNRRILH